MIKDFNGIYDDLGNEDYHAEKKHLSSSNLKMLLKDPAKFYDEKILGNRVNVQKNAFDEGNFAHSLILEPGNIPDEYAFFEGFRKAGKDWELFKKEHTNKIILSKPQKARVEKWFEAYKALPTAVSLLDGCQSEISLFGELNGVPVKVRADALNIEQGFIADVKTTAYDTDVDSFKNVVNDLKYDLSAALYCKVFEKHFGKPFDFYFVVLGKKDGMCQVYKASEDTINTGNVGVVNALNMYKKCLETNIWTSTKKLATVDNSNYEILEI